MAFGGDALGWRGTLCGVELPFSPWLDGICILPVPGEAGGKTAPQDLGPWPVAEPAFVHPPRS